MEKTPYAPFSEGSDEIHSFHIYFHHFQTKSRGAPQLAQISQPHNEPAQINHIANFREGTRFKQRLYEDKQLKAWNMETASASRLSTALCKAAWEPQC